MARDTNLGISTTSTDVGTGVVFDITVTEDGGGGGGGLAGQVLPGKAYKLNVFVGPNGSLINANQYFQYVGSGSSWIGIPPTGVNLNGGQTLAIRSQSGAPSQTYTFRPVTGTASSAPYVDVTVS